MPLHSQERKRDDSREEASTPAQWCPSLKSNQREANLHQEDKTVSITSSKSTLLIPTTSLPSNCHVAEKPGRCEKANFSVQFPLKARSFFLFFLWNLPDRRLLALRRQIIPPLCTIQRNNGVGKQDFSHSNHKPVKIA